MKTRLIIIGNGFDLQHNIQSGYIDFAAYFDYIDHENYSEFSNHLFHERDILAETAELEGYYVEPSKDAEEPENWSNFENQLSTLSPSYFAQKAREHECDYGSDGFREGDRYAFGYWFADDFANELYGAVENTFRCWVGTLNDNIDSDDDIKPLEWVKLLCNTSNTIFLSFNYTETLEKLYKVEADRILHLHGSLQSEEVLILGHGKDPSLCTKELKEFFYRTTNIDYTGREEDYVEDDVPEVPENIDNSWDQVEQYFTDRKKDTNKCIQDSIAFFDNLEYVENVYVIGHSLNDVDLPYFEKIKQEISASAIWHVYFYDSDEEDKFSNILENQLLIRPECIRLYSYPA